MPNVSNAIEYIASAIYNNESRLSRGKSFQICKFVYFSNLWYLRDFIIRQEVNLQAILKKWGIVRFKNPTWDKHWEQVIRYENMKFLKNL